MTIFGDISFTMTEGWDFRTYRWLSI